MHVLYHEPSSTTTLVPCRPLGSRPAIGPHGADDPMAYAAHGPRVRGLVQRVLPHGRGPPMCLHINTFCKICFYVLYDHYDSQDHGN